MRQLLILVGSIILLHSCATEEKKMAKPKGFNVVLVVVDDLNDWIAPLGGHKQSITPNFSRLAEEGIQFNNAYCTAPACNPSRVSMLTGVQPYNSGVYTNSDEMRKSPRLNTAFTLPQLFKKNGYQSLSIGKIFHEPDGLRADSISWSFIKKEEGNLLKSMDLPNDSTLANGMIYQNAVEKNLDWFETETNFNGASDFKNTLWAADVIRSSKDPYFLACGIYKPHLPWYLPKGFMENWDLESLDLAPFLDADLEDLPSEAQQIVRMSSPRSDYNRLTEVDKHKEATRAYLAAIQFADKCLGNILDALDEEGDSTILIVVGDHGWHLGEKRHYRKFTLWERATKVPLFIRLPGGEMGGAKVDELVSLVDLYPTIMKFCDLETDQELDGEDLNYLFTKPTEIRNRFITTSLDSASSAVRYKQWRYIHYKNGGEELYDQSKDPNEWENLACEANYQAIKDTLQRMMPNSWQPSVSGKGHLIAIEK